MTGGPTSTEAWSLAQSFSLSKGQGWDLHLRAASSACHGGPSGPDGGPELRPLGQARTRKVVVTTVGSGSHLEGLVEKTQGTASFPGDAAHPRRTPGPADFLYFHQFKKKKSVNKNCG